MEILLFIKSRIITRENSDKIQTMNKKRNKGKKSNCEMFVTLFEQPQIFQFSHNQTYPSIAILHKD
jgi:hypothetical protein